jgi:nicotinamide-nucleotide amidase
VYLQGVVSYSNEAKVSRLGVKPGTLDTYGAVSEETAREMAEGIAKGSGSDVGISVTGIAGPDGGTTDKPVGLVYIGLCIDGKVTVKRCMFTGNRSVIRERSSLEALDMLRRALL